MAEATAQTKERAPVEPSAQHHHLACCIIIGMAGSGKTTLMQRISVHLAAARVPAYVLNLDPAVSKLAYAANVDIRDSLNYKTVMKQYGLGPNGAILTALNIFSTRFDQVLALITRRAPEVQYVFADTPGQIEAFTWSASGTIITDTLASSFPTCVLFVVDTPRTRNPSTFVSNMLYACSVLYKTRLPLVVVFNKADVVDPAFAQEWMTDYDAFFRATESEATFAVSLAKSSALALEEFYRNIQSVAVSAVTGKGIDELLAAIQSAKDDYRKNYFPQLCKAVAKAKAREEMRQNDELRRFEEDVREEVRAAGSAGKSSRARAKAPGTSNRRARQEQQDFEDEAYEDDMDNDEDAGDEEDDLEALYLPAYHDLELQQPDKFKYQSKPRRKLVADENLSEEEQRELEELKKLVDRANVRE